MDVSVSKEFIKVYDYISKLEKDITDVAKEHYDTSIVSYDEINNVPENLSDFNNDLEFVTEQQVDDKINNIEFPEQDCSNLLKKDGEKEQECSIPTKFDKLCAKTQKESDSSENVATTEFVHNLVKEGTEQTKSWVFGTYGKKEDEKDFVTEQELQETLTDYPTKQAAEVIATDIVEEAISELDIPTKVSQLQNDSGYITLNDIPEDLVTSVNGQQGDVVIDIPVVPTNVSAFTNDAGYITGPVVTSVNNQTGAVSVQENVQANWNATSGLAAILNKPALKRVATTGDYNDLDNTPDLTTKIDKVQSTDNAIVRFDGNQGDVQNSDVIIDDSGDMIIDSSIYLTTIYQSVHTAGNSRIYFGSKESPVAYAAANSAGSFGMYNGQGKGFSCQPTLNFFSTSNIDLGRAGNSWKDFYFTGQFYRTSYGYEFPDKSGTVALTSDLFSGDYNDLTNKPTIPVVPTNVSAFTNDAGYLTSHQDISGKYDKTGGNISGDVDIDGTLKLNIEDEDYDSAITMTARLDNNLGTTLTLTGNADSTQYKTLVRNIATPVNNYDAANKKYVDDNILIPNYYLVELNLDGSVNRKASSLTWATVSSNLTNPNEADYLDVLWENGYGTNQYTRFYVKATEIVEVNTGDIKFIGDVEYAGIQRRIVFTLDHNDVLTTTSITTLEIISNKKSSVVDNLSNDYYPSTNAVYNEFQRKPVTIWEVSSGQTGLLSSEQNITENPTWQLTGLNMSPYKRIKIYTKAGKKTSGVGQDASNTPAVVLEMSLDDRAAGPTGGHFMGSVVGQKPNDTNRLFTVTCAVSADKTSFAVLRMTTLYGTAATANSDCNGYVFKIEGYYD